MDISALKNPYYGKKDDFVPQSIIFSLVEINLSMLCNKNDVKLSKIKKCNEKYFFSFRCKKLKIPI